MADRKKTPRRDERRLTDEEAALWARVAETTEPLSDGRKIGADHTPAAKRLVSTPARRETRPAAQPTRAPRAPTPAPSGIGRKEVRQITSGRAEIGARLDLHGLRQGEAYAALGAFLQRAQGAGHRYVLIITGKGSGPQDEARGFYETSERGVLKRMVPKWLAEPAFRPMIAGVQDAHARHGGSGALYVRLRRLRPKE